MYSPRRPTRAFGGDPQRVMIMGNSAGGASVAGHLVMPESFGLYSSASMESPGGHQGWMGEGQRINDDWTSASMLLKNSAQLAKECGCGSSEDLTCMQAVPIDELMKNAEPVRFAPALGTEGEYPLSLMREGKYHQVPIIVGGNDCESCSNAERTLGKYTDSIQLPAANSATALAQQRSRKEAEFQTRHPLSAASSFPSSLHLGGLLVAPTGPPGGPLGARRGARVRFGRDGFAELSRRGSVEPP